MTQQPDRKLEQAQDRLKEVEKEAREQEQGLRDNQNAPLETMPRPGNRLSKFTG